MLTPELTERLQKKLDLNEQLLWAGKPIPRAFSKASVRAMLFAIPWSAITWTVFGTFMSTLWFGGGTAKFNGRPAAELSLWLRLGFTAFFIPFITISIATLFAPLWQWLSMRGQYYAVTTKRALALGRFRVKSWRAPEIDFIDRCDRRNHTGDLYFVYGNSGPTGFDNLPSEALAPAENALKNLRKSLTADA